MLLIQHEGAYDNSIVKKYQTGYKIYQNALRTVSENKNLKPFSVDLSSLDKMPLNIK